MKPKISEFIPLLGMYLYFKRYFSAEKRDYKEALGAILMNLYHSFIIILIAAYLISIFS